MPARNTTYRFGAERLSLKEIAERTGIYHKTLLYRFRQHQSMEQAVREPVRSRRACGRQALAKSRHKWA
ncbi:MAG TPA: hypothetical protein VGE22_11055 [Solimonas sp.]